MHEPRPYGLHVIDGQLTDNDEAFINTTAKQFTNQKQVSNLDNDKRVYDLPDGGYVIFQDMGGNFRVIAHKSKSFEDVLSLGIAKYHLPMLFSGVITKAIIAPDEGVAMTVTEQTQQRLSQYHKKNYPPQKLVLKRFAIEYADNLREFVPKEPNEKLYTQYDKLHATWYSGAMAEVVQIVGGYGKQFGKNDEVDSGVFTPYEKITMEVPKQVQDKIIEQMGNHRLPAYLGFVQSQITYDYKYSNTHGVSFDDKNNPWLVRINNHGVWVMPLPMIPATTTQAFRDYIEGVGDGEILAILDRFGGMPSGEDFPKEDKDFYAWVRTGAISKVCDTANFYNASAYYSGCGWSFNLKGTEGYNTCYSYGDDGIAWGCTYKLKLALQALPNSGWVIVDNSKLPQEQQAVLNQYTNQLILALPLGTHKALAILYKLRRTSKQEVYERANSVKFDGKKEVDYWDNLIVESEDKHTGSVSLVYTGRLYHNEKPKFQPQIKFPEPAMNGCVSFDFSPQGEHPAKKPNCDTVMFAYYVGDDLKVVKYFVNWDSYIRKIQSNYEPYMTAGSWEQEETTGFSGLQGYFYTSDIDERDDIAPVTTLTNIDGKDKDYDTKPFFAFTALGSMEGTMWRNRYFTHLTKSKTDTNRKLSLAICVPYFCRNACLVAIKDSIANVKTYENLSLYAVQDPTTYRYWTYHSVFAWFLLGKITQKGSPYPVDGNPVWVEEMNYSSLPDSDFADNGDWVGGLPADYTWLIHPDNNTWEYSGGGGRPKVNEYTKYSDVGSQLTGKVMVSINDKPQDAHGHVPDSDYYYPSPDENGNLFYRDACKVVFGETIYANVSEYDENNRRKYWGYSKLADHVRAHNFIGVINE